MIIAQEKRKTNIAEYLLYMWQVEDLIRANQFDLDRVERSFIAQFRQPEPVLAKMRQWYADLIIMMKQEGLSERGHLQFLRNTLDDLERLHLRLLASEAQDDYQKTFARALPALGELLAKSPEPKPGPVELCFNALYGRMLMRLEGRQISEATLEATARFADLLALLAARFLAEERGELDD